MVANFDDNNKNNKQSKAVALKYDKEKNQAPHVSAKGKGLLAERIIEIAESHNIPVEKDTDLVNILETVEIDQEIPLEVYAVVAEIFAYIYKVNKSKAES